MGENNELTIACKNAAIWMTDHDDEIEDSRNFIETASGDVLITGLGIGMLPAYLSKQERVKTITIIEKEKDVMQFVGYQLSKNFPKIKIIHADAMDWQPDKKYDCAYHDIWEVWPTKEQAEPIMDKYAPFVGRQEYWQKHGITRT